MGERLWRFGIAAACGLGVLGASIRAQFGPTYSPFVFAAATIQDGGPITTADQLLDALERAGDQIQSLAAGIRYDRTFPLQGDRQVRVGKLYFLNPAAGATNGTDPKAKSGRKFAIVFDELWLGAQKRRDQKVYIFDGEWLVEKMPADKLMLKRQVVPPGETFDPLRIGEGPLPIPIGQPKKDILSRFTAELLPATEGLTGAGDGDAEEEKLLTDMRAMAQGAYQLKLTPKAAGDDDFQEIRLWYKLGKNGELLPRMARTVNTAGEVSSVLLVGVQAQVAGAEPNAEAKPPADVFDTRQPPPESGWDVTVEPYRASGERPGTPAAREPADAGDR